MTLHLPTTPLPRRLRNLLMLLLLSLGLLAGVSVSQPRALVSQTTRLTEVAVPQLGQVHTLASAVDEQRGMAALHLVLRSDSDRLALEGRLQAGRLRVERQMASLARRLHSDADRRHHQAVAARLQAFWALQDRLLAASRRAATDPAAAAQARALLAGEAQQAFERLRADIEAWWTHAEQAAQQTAALAQAAAEWLQWAIGAMAGLAGLALVVVVVSDRRERRAKRQGAAQRLRQPGAGAPPVLDGRAAQPHLQALNDAVAAARRGEPGRAAGLSAHEARHLAEQVAAAAQGLKALIDRPPAAADPAPAPDATAEAPPQG